MKFWAGVAFFSIRIYGAASLKDRRHVVRSLLERARNRFNASAADLGPDAWDRADLAFACAGSSHQEMTQRIDQLFSFMEKREEEGEFEVMSASREVFSYGDIQNRASE
ncbi:MAG: DUF503 domain-containing protein [Synergistaceae bacterium]|jgi:uncharacterized protein YlxP (DUF503 family)|nr:DUF503 domain-containing protein [Synergistaceae bacterium]